MLHTNYYGSNKTYNSKDKMYDNCVLVHLKAVHESEMII